MFRKVGKKYMETAGNCSDQANRGRFNYWYCHCPGGAGDGAFGGNFW